MRSFLVVSVLLLASDAKTFEMPERLEQFLADGQWDHTLAGFRIIALSHVADGCVGQASAHPELTSQAQACVARVVRRARELPQSDDGLYLTHLNLIYGAADRVGTCLDAIEHERVSRALARRSMRDPLHHAASYQGVSLRWPADQSATLASLARFDASHGTTQLAAPLDAWRRVMSKHVDPKTGLPESEVTGKGLGAKYPRGCAQSYISRYLNEVDPALAASWWKAYREHFLVRLGGVVGFREWPRKVTLRADTDSGPIVFGIGAAASALALSAAKAQGDAVLAGQLESSASVALMSGVGGTASTDILAQAILFQGRWQPMTVSP